LKVLFAGKPFERLLNIIEPAFKGHDIRIADNDDLPDAIGWAEVMILRPMPFGEDLLSRAPRLRLVQQWGVGVEGLDVAACTRHGIWACNVPSRGTGNAEGVAEIAIMHMMMQGRRYKRAQEKLREGKIFTPPGVALWKKRACIVGLGNVGHCVAERLRGLGMEIVGVDRSVSRDYSDWGFSKIYAMASLAEAVNGCRFVVLCLALTPETDGLIDEKILRSMDRDAFIINVARGPIIERKALETALAEKWINGAGLDVLWEEPPAPDDPLLDDGRVTVTPHIGGVTDVSMDGVMSFIVENINTVAEGGHPKGCLNEIQDSPADG